MGLAENLRLAASALAHTRTVVYKGADNRPEDMESANRFRSFIPAVALSFVPSSFRPLTRQEVNKQRDEKLVPLVNNEMPVRREIEIAKHVKDSGIGRCGEQSAVAFTYLLQHANAITFGIVNLVDGNHDFVVIGVNEKIVSGPHVFTAAPAWPNDAVILDPWENLFFAVAEGWTREIPRILNRTQPNYNKPTLELRPATFHTWVVNPAFGYA